MRRSTRAGRGQNPHTGFNVNKHQCTSGLDALVQAVHFAAAAAVDPDLGLDSDDLAGSEEEFNLDADDDVAAYLLDSEDGGDIDSQHEDAASEEEPVSSEEETPSSKRGRGRKDAQKKHSDARCRGWTKAERQQLAELDLERTKPKTNKQYLPFQTQWKAYARRNKLAPQVISIEQIPDVGRFFSAWVEGKEGASLKNRKSGQRCGPQGAMNVHAAMQQWVRQCCTKAGVPVFNLTDDSGYQSLYRSLTKDRNGKRKTLVPVSFTRDHYVRLQVNLYNSHKPTAARTRLMLALATSAVARGDEIRDVRLCNMAIEHIDVIGPAQCYAVRYALGDNKTAIAHVPEQKAFIRGRMPETCTLGALGEYLHVRFKHKGEVLPDPGSAELEGLYLFPGENASCCISYQNHARLVRETLVELAILVEKVTHLSRIFAAQLLIAMGLRVEDVQRAGGWLKDCLGTAYIIIALSPESLLALAMWRKDGSDFQCFGDPRFHIAVPDELLFHALPALKKFRQKAVALADQAMAPGAPAELKRPALMAAQVMRVITVATVARIQDAIAVGDQYPDNPFNADIMKHPLYSEYAARYKATMQLGGLDHMFPTSEREQLKQMLAGISGMQQALQQVLTGQKGIEWANSAAGQMHLQQQQDSQGKQQQQTQSQQLEQLLLQKLMQDRQQQQQSRTHSQGGRQTRKGLQPQEPQAEEQQQTGSEAPDSAARAAASAAEGTCSGAAGPASATAGTPGGTGATAAAASAVTQGDGGLSPAAAAGIARSSPAADISAAAAAGGGERMLFTPGGTDYSVGNLPFGYTPQGMHNRDFWHAEQPPLQQPFQQHGSMPQPQLEPQPQQRVFSAAEVQELIDQALQRQQQKQQQQQQQQQQTGFTERQVQHIVSQALQQQQQKFQQMLSEVMHDSNHGRAVPDSAAAAAPSAAAVLAQQMAATHPTFGADVAAHYLQPFISSNPNLAAAVGSRAQAQGLPYSSMQGNGAAALVDLINAACKAGAKQAVAEANGVQPPSAPAAPTGAHEAGISVATAAAGMQQPASAAAAASSSKTPDQLAPGFKNWGSLSQMMEWYCKEEDIPWVNGAGEEVLVSRSFYRAQVVAYSDKACWCKEKKQRVTEYDAIYWYLHQYAINVAKTEDTLFDVHDAAKRVQAEKKIKGGTMKEGKMTFPQFMLFCVAERKAAAVAAKAEAAAKAAAAAEAQEVEGEGGAEDEAG